MKKYSLWMGVSGALGFSFFLVANFTSIFLGLNLIAGLVQVALNVFVFTTWFRGYRSCPPGFKKLVAFVGTVIPLVMMSITIIRVIVPSLSSL